MDDLTERLAAIRDTLATVMPADSADFQAPLHEAVGQLFDAVEAVMELHKPASMWFPATDHREELCRADKEPWPCATVQAISEHLGATP